MMNRKKLIGGSIVDNHNSVKTIAYCVALALGQLGAVSIAHADSAVGQLNTTIGNSRQMNANPVAMQASGGYDPDAQVPTRRTPTGQMYNIPYANPEVGEEGKPSYHGNVDVGVVSVAGGKDAALYKTYSDQRSGFVINDFSLQLEKPDVAHYLEIVGGGVGRNDQFYGVTIGKYNDWKIKAYYNEIPHTFTSTAKPIWDGIGTNHLTLKRGIAAGGGLTYLGANTGVNSLCTGAAGTLCFSSAVYSSSGNWAQGTPISAAQVGAAATNLVDGGINSQATRAILAAQANMGYSEISLLRTTSGLSLDKNLSDTLKSFFTYSNEKRLGARPFGMVQGGGGGANNVEFAEPIDFLTHDFKVGLRYVGDRTQANVTAGVNLFRNNNPTFTVDVPFNVAATATGALITQGRFVGMPNNENYNLKGEIMQSLPEIKSKLSAVVAWNSARQNDFIQAPTITQGQGTFSAAAGAFNGNFNEWSQPGSVSEATSNARIDNKLVNLKWSMEATRDLNLGAGFRYQNQKVDTMYLACNPLASYGNGVKYSAFGCSGVWGRFLNDGGNFAVINPGTQTSGNLITGVNGAATPSFTGIGPIRSNQWNKTERELGFTGDYRLSNTQSLNGSIARETVARDNMEVANLNENKFKVGYVNRDIADGSLRLSYGFDKRRGSHYNVIQPFLAAYSGFFDPSTVPAGTNLVGTYVPRSADIHKLFIADRNQTTINARYNYPLREDLDLGILGNWKKQYFPQNQLAGQKDFNVGTAGFDLNYQPSTDLSFSGYYTYANSMLTQGDVNNTGVPAAVSSGYACTNGTVTPWGVITPYTAAEICGTASHMITFNRYQWWGSKTHDINHTIGLGFKMALTQKTLEVNYVRSQSRTRMSYAYFDPNTTPGASTAVAAAVQAVAGGGMPDNTFVSNKIDAGLMMPLDKQTSVRVGAAYENGKTRDWHYPTSMTQFLVYGTGNTSQMDAGPQDFTVTTISVMLNYKL